MLTSRQQLGVRFPEFRRSGGLFSIHRTATRPKIRRLKMIGSNYGSQVSAHSFGEQFRNLQMAQLAEALSSGEAQGPTGDQAPTDVFTPGVSNWAGLNGSHDDIRQ